MSHNPVRDYLVSRHLRDLGAKKANPFLPALNDLVKIAGSLRFQKLQIANKIHPAPLGNCTRRAGHEGPCNGWNCRPTVQDENFKLKAELARVKYERNRLYFLLDDLLKQLGVEVK